ncbi:MAG TPA: PEP-CTERM sorting domain-containing protein, partial [Fimbriimonas sp.]|nr:PEP-CTERM sorting domain-containing protein [Fimbriimonas sp.]
MRVLATFSLLAVASSTVFGQISQTGPFSGPLSEGFESFPNYSAQSGFFFPSGSSLFAGAATINSSSLVIYEPGPAIFGLGDKGLATTNSGAKGLGSPTSGSSLDLIFSSPMHMFGGYFNVGVGTGATTNLLAFTFYDSANVQIGSTFNILAPVDNGMAWMGFTSSLPFTRVQMIGHIPVMDDLQANPVPEPSSLAALSLFAVAALRRR